MEHDYTNKHFIAVLFAFCGLVFIFLIFLAFIQKNHLLTGQSASTHRPADTPTPTPVVTGRLFLKAKDAKKIYTTNEPVHLLVYADSHGTPIDGYDLVLRFDEAKVSFVSAKTLLPSFPLFSIVKKGAVNATGAKKIADTTLAIFADTALAELVFQPKKEGAVSFLFDATHGSTKDTNLINEKSTDILSTAQGLSIFIGSAVVLPLNQEVPMGNNVKLRLVTLSIPDEQCMDCIESARFKVFIGNQTRELEFKTGGIVGLQQTTQEAFDYHFELDAIQKNSLKLKVSRGDF